MNVDVRPERMMGLAVTPAADAPSALERAAPSAFKRANGTASGPARQWLRPAIFRRR